MQDTKYAAMYKNLQNYKCENQLSFDDCFIDYKPDDIAHNTEIEEEELEP